jgi:serine/threonine protein kinase
LAHSEPVGRGGHGYRFRARSGEDGQLAAIKIISPKIANKSAFQARFKREARLMASLDHPHILPVYDFGLQDERIYLVMRLLEDGSLA